MKRVAIFLIASLALVEVGCKSKATPPAAVPAAGNVFKNEKGVVTGRIPELGLKLEVRGLKENGVGSTQSFVSQSASNEKLETKRWEIAAGEVKILLDRNGEGPIALRIDGQNYGTFVPDVELLIDEKRQVLVNSEKREPN